MIKSTETFGSCLHETARFLRPSPILTIYLHFLNGKPEKLFSEILIIVVKNATSGWVDMEPCIHISLLHLTNWCKLHHLKTGRSLYVGDITWQLSTYVDVTVFIKA